MSYNSPTSSPAHSQEISASGYCRLCDTVHGLAMGPAYEACLELIHHFERYETIDLQPGPESDPQLTTEHLFGESRGKMFGVLTGRTSDGNDISLHAFSGQYNSLWHVPGWAPPLFDLEAFHTINTPGERAIKDIGSQMAGVDKASEHWRTLKTTRRQMSRTLMQQIHALYRLNNFQGQESTLSEAFIGGERIPTGCGDCCGPKLLQMAATLDIQPTGIAEFFWGRSNRSNSRHHGQFYASCKEKCQPILGHMLCGIRDTSTKK